MKSPENVKIGWEMVVKDTEQSGEFGDLKRNDRKIC